MRAVLTYHSVDPSGSVISVDEGTFRRHVAFLASGGVRVLPVHELVAADEAENAVALTFDDGFQNFADVAWPLLRDAGLPATVYVVSDRAGTDNRWGAADEPGIPTLPLMGWETLRRLAAEGAHLGSHTRTHARLTSVDDARLADELESSKERIEGETDSEVLSFAYPFGDHDERVAARARRVYPCACTTELRMLGPGTDPSRVPRLDAYYLRDAGRLESYGTGAFRRFLSTRAFARGVRERMQRVFSRGSA